MTKLGWGVNIDRQKFDYKNMVFSVEKPSDKGDLLLNNNWFSIFKDIWLDVKDLLQNWKNVWDVVCNLNNSIENVIWSCWEFCNILSNKKCEKDCWKYYKAYHEEVSNLLNGNSDSIYTNLSKILFTTSWWKLNVDLHDSVENFFEDVSDYFNDLINPLKENHDLEEVYRMYDLIHKFFIMNHGNIIEWSVIYDLSSLIIWKLSYFLDDILKIWDKVVWSDFNKDVHPSSFYSKEELLLENIVWRYYISHSHLKEIDFSSFESAIESFNSIMERQIIWIKKIFKTWFGWSPYKVEDAMRVFSINYCYIYWKFLNYLEDQDQDISYIKHDYFANFKNLDLKERQGAIFDRLIDLFKEDPFYKEKFFKLANKKNEEVDIVESTSENIVNIDYIVDSFLENSSVNWYDSVMILETLHHLLSLFPDKEKDTEKIIDLGYRLLLDDKDLDPVYNSMKLRTLNLILRRMSIKNVLHPSLMEFISEVERNMEFYGSNISTEYSRVSLWLAGIYSNFYKFKKEEWELVINKEIKEALRLIKEGWGDKELLFNSINKKKDDIEKELSNLKNNSISNFSKYSKLYLDSGVDFSRDNVGDVEKQIIENLFFEHKWDSSYLALKDLYDANENLLFSEKKSETKDEVNEITRNILRKDFNLNKINKALRSVAKIFFKDICDIYVAEKDKMQLEGKFYNEVFELWEWSWYFFVFNVNKKSTDIFKSIKEDNLDFIKEIEEILKEFIGASKEHFFNEISDLKNWKSFEKDVDNMVENKEDWALVVVDLNYYSPKNQSNDKKAVEIISKKINENAEFYKQLKKQWINWLYFELYHVNDLRFNLLFKWENIDEKSLIKSVELYLKNIEWVLETKVFWESWKINRQTERQCVKWNSFSNETLDSEIYLELLDVIENRPEDVLFFVQPIVDSNGKVFKHEVLTRIKRKDWSILFPDSFFPMLKKDPAFNYKFTKLLIKRTFEAVSKYWKDLSINLSTQDISSYWEDLIKYTTSLAKEFWEDVTRKITIELLEDNFGSSFTDVLLELKSMWCKIAIDDFWAGSSNFERLLELVDENCIDIVKIDWSLIKWLVKYYDKDWNNFKKNWENKWNPYEWIFDIQKDHWISFNHKMIEWVDYNVQVNKKNKNLVKAIVWYVNEEWLDVICEFIEDYHIVGVLDEIWNNYRQWYFFGKPEFFEDVLGEKVA